MKSLELELGAAAHAEGGVRAWALIHVNKRIALLGMSAIISFFLSSFSFLSSQI